MEVETLRINCKNWAYSQCRSVDSHISILSPGKSIRSKPISVSHLQQQLQDIYELNIDQNVNDYLITSPALVNMLDRGNSNPHLKEKLLLKQDENELSLSLFLHNDVVQKIHEDDPVQDMHKGNIQDFCFALEGVSHFLYLFWNATYDRCVTLLEMELQAEIDKFVMMIFCLEKQKKQVPAGYLRKLLFETAQYHRQLNESERQRYQDASNLAEKYCWKLESDYMANRSRQQMLCELRKFYRLAQTDKLRWINQLR